MEQKVSVIVPVYNVEQYLPKCLDSILAQTYQNLEIVLVDDGSPDRSGEICDQYAERDSRIQVIHQENRGASAARNRGLDAATGDWIGFIDSDDWIDPEFYETLLQTAVEYDAEIACCGFDYNGAKMIRDEPVTVFQGREIFYQLLTRKYGASSLCNKIFRKDLKTYLRNREDIQLNEDLAASYVVCQKVERMAFANQALYHYTTRKSGCVTHYTPEDNHLAVQLAEERAEEQKGDAIAYNLCLRHCVTMRLREINQAVKYDKRGINIWEARKKLLANYRHMTDKNALNRRERQMVGLLRFTPLLYKPVVKLKFKITKV